MGAIKGKTMLLLFILAVIGLLMLAGAVRTKSAFVILATLTFGMSFFLAFGLIGIGKGLLIVIVATLITLYLDSEGILA